MDGLATDLNQDELAEMIKQADTTSNGHVTYEGLYFR